MKKNKIIGIIIAMLAVSAVGYYFWQNSNRAEMGDAPKTQIEDTREQVTDQQDVQYQSTVLVNSIEKESEFGTGYVVGKNTVITNKHVVLDVKDNPEKAVVRVGHKDKDGNVEFIDFKIKNIILPKEDAIDVAAIQLEPKDGKSISDYRKIAEFGDIAKVKKGSKVTLVGFPGDKEYATMWTGTGEVDMVDGNMISFGVFTAPGNSGSPLFDSEGKVIGMNNAGGDGQSFGFLIDEDIASFIRSNIA